MLEFHVFAIIKTDNNPQLETPLYGVLLVKHVKKKKKTIHLLKYILIKTILRLNIIKKKPIHFVSPFATLSREKNRGKVTNFRR